MSNPIRKSVFNTKRNLKDSTNLSNSRIVAADNYNSTNKSVNNSSYKSENNSPLKSPTYQAVITEEKVFRTYDHDMVKDPMEEVEMEAHIRDLFKLYDKDGDGSVDKDELILFLNSIQRPFSPEELKEMIKSMVNKLNKKLKIHKKFSKFLKFFSFFKFLSFFKLEN